MEFITIQTTKLPETGFLRVPEVLKLIPVAESTWWAGVAKGTFPKPVKLGPKITAWKIEDIKAFIDSFSSK